MAGGGCRCGFKWRAGGGGSRRRGLAPPRLDGVLRVSAPRRSAGRTRETTADPAGLPARRLAFLAVAEVLARRVPLDDTLDRLTREAALPARDEALARAIAVTSFRRFGTLRKALQERLDRAPPREADALALLVTGAAQLLFLDVPDHAAVDVTVGLARADRRLQHLGGLANALLRRIIRERDRILDEADPLAVDTPEWLATRWLARYGETAPAIAAAHRRAAPLDLTVNGDPAAWAERLGGERLPTGTIRIAERTAVRDLPGYAEGGWWVQDAAAALPARLLGAGPGERVVDLCAAPGGKTAQLAAQGAEVLAVDRSEPRLRRLRDNMARLGLSVQTKAADALTLEESAFDAVLLDAPCSATGTIRRHPDVAWVKTEADLRKLAGLQTRLLDKAAALTRPGGRLVFCTCSLEPEEGEAQVAAFLERHPAFRRVPVRADEIGGLGECVTPEGDLRTLPCHGAGFATPGMDGFFAARLTRHGGGA